MNPSWSVYDREGRRKYLNSKEISDFIYSAKRAPLATRLFCWLMAVTGCRISEALSLTGAHIDFVDRHVVIRSLKKRRERVFRTVPLPGDLLAELAPYVEALCSRDELLWPWSRMTGYRRICEVMADAAIKGDHASPKGLRHGFAVKAIQSKVPLNLVQRWLGHADIKTTAIYANAVGPEEREIASRMWGEDEAGRGGRGDEFLAACDESGSEVVERSAAEAPSQTIAAFEISGASAELPENSDYSLARQCGQLRSVTELDILSHIKVLIDIITSLRCSDTAVAVAGIKTRYRAIDIKRYE